MRLVNRILLAVLALLGFASCKPESEPLVMYGPAETEYTERSVTYDSDSDTVATENSEKE